MCAWSLQPRNVDELISACAQLGLGALQLPLKVFHRAGLLRPGWNETATLEALSRAGIAVCSGMFATHGEDYSSLESIRDSGGVRSHEHWPANTALAVEDAARARRLGLQLVSFHAGFLPEEPGDPLRELMIDRLRTVIDAFADQGLDVAFETGQETAETLLAVLEELERPNVGVNFDPANMILYGKGDPCAALDILAPRVRQLHVKDALPAEAIGEWGTEVVVGTGRVHWEELFAVLARHDLTIDCLIEREAGDDRLGDVALAASRVGALVAGLGGSAS